MWHSIIHKKQAKRIVLVLVDDMSERGYVSSYNEQTKIKFMKGVLEIWLKKTIGCPKSFNLRAS